MSFIRQITHTIRQLIYYTERERVDEKLSAIDERIDKLDIQVAVITTELRSLREVFCSNLETLEQMMNAIKSSQEALSLVSKAQYTYLDASLLEVKTLVKALT